MRFPDILILINQLLNVNNNNITNVPFPFIKREYWRRPGELEAFLTFKNHPGQKREIDKSVPDVKTKMI